MNNLQFNNEQNPIAVPQLPHGIALPETFSGSFEKHVFDNYLFPNGDIPANYEMSDLEFLQLKNHIELEYGHLYSALLKKKAEIVKRVQKKYYKLHRTAEQETNDRRTARDVIRIAGEKRAAKEAAEEVLRDQRILRLEHLAHQRTLRLEHLASLAVNCEEYMIRLEDTINYNNSDLFSYTDEDISRCRQIFDEFVIFKNAMIGGSNDDENCAQLAVRIMSRIKIFTLKLKDHHLDFIDSYFSSLLVQNVSPAEDEGLTVDKTKGPRPGVPQKKDCDPVNMLKGGTIVLSHQIKVRQATLGKKMKEETAYISDRAIRSQQEDLDSERRSNNKIIVNEERARLLVANSLEEVGNESDIANIDVQVKALIATASGLLQRKLQIMNNRDDGKALTEIHEAQSLLILMDPLLEYPDTVHVQGQRTHGIIPILMELLEAATYDTRQHRSRKRKYGIYNGNINNGVNTPNNIDGVQSIVQEEDLEENGVV